jgi:Family of unknown function (DUF6226)
MMGDRWGPGGPPPEAYSRVTNPERFRPLHGAAERLLSDLEGEFDVSREEGRGLDPGLSRDEPTIRLTPHALEAGPLTIAFSPFPGLRLRLGHWWEEHIPACGCDACDETANHGQARLGWLAKTLTSGQFRESIRLGLLRDGWLFHALENATGRSESGESRIARARARSMIARAGGKRRFDYGPWPPRRRAGASSS